VAIPDELDKYRRWKSFLKGFFDTYADRIRLLVMGSSGLDLIHEGGDSLMGRYFLRRIQVTSPQTLFRHANYLL
jgi:predicted AAA+ superfamily ATPase